MKLRFRRIIEAIEVAGATCIGSGHGFDVFNITTWNALQQFHTPEGRNGGDFWMHNEDTFNQHMTEESRLYIFAEQDTAVAHAAIFKDPTTSSTIKFLPQTSDSSYSVKCIVNFYLEVADSSSSELSSTLNLPLYLIPDIDVAGLTQFDGIIRDSDNQIEAILPQFAVEPFPDALILSADQTQLPSHMTNFGQLIDSIVIPRETTTLGSYSLSGVTGQIQFECDNASAPAGLDEAKLGSNATVTFNYGKSQEEIDRLAADQAEEDCRREYLRSHLFDYTIIQHSRERGKKLPHKEKEVMINGLNSRKNNLTRIKIPDTIDGYPVTKIAPFAFYSVDDVSVIELPDGKNLREIGQGAFPENANYRVDGGISTDCIVGKYNITPWRKN